MTRCEYDGVFYRVFCVTLLAIALIFTVILTNVFIDIDGLLSIKKKANSQSEDAPIALPDTSINKGPFHDENQPETFYNINEDENDDAVYRTKRSLDTSNFKFHIKNPKIKKILTTRLATLLEELDAEESHIKLDKNTAKETNRNVEKIIVGSPKTNPEVNYRRSFDDEDDDGSTDELLHLAMHNILLQGILGHMDLSEVYKQVHSLVNSFKHNGLRDFRRRRNKEKKPKSSENSKELALDTSSYHVENKLFEEMVQCDDLQKQINDGGEGNEHVEIIGDTRRSSSRKEPKMLIKTVIYITSLTNNKNKENETDSEKNIKGIIKLIYNGKSINFKQMDDEDKAILINRKPDVKKLEKEHTAQPLKDIRKKLDDDSDYIKVDIDNSQIPSYFLNKAVKEYMMMNAKEMETGYERNTEKEEKLKNKRLKRNIKKGNVNFSKIEKNKSKSVEKSNDGELYVEIETHFDSKGIKDDKKRKKVKDIVEKIREAIKDDLNTFKEVKKKIKHLKVKKRLQNPLDTKNSNSFLVNKIMIPLNNKISLRKFEPINQPVTKDDNMPNLSDKEGDNWKKSYSGPRFLSRSKSINSGEMGEVNLDYKATKSSDIPQRMQQPLNLDSNEYMEGNSYYDLGNLKFYVKEFDGTGFSIGFNQYVAEPPDTESMKLFSGLQNLIKTYHQNYDLPESEVTTKNNDMNEEQPTVNSYENNHSMKKREVNRSLRHDYNDDNDYHSNKYKIIFNNDFLPYDSYQEIYEDKNKKVSISLIKDAGFKESHTQNPHKTKLVTKDSTINHLRELPLIIADDIFYKSLRPSEIFGIANLLDRKKRSIKVGKISKINSKSKISKIINTKRRVLNNGRVFLKNNNKRNKRQVDKIRIIASDTLPSLPENSDDNIFVVSDEHLFADRAVVRRVDLSETTGGYDKASEEHYEYIDPYFYESQRDPSYVSNTFSARSRHNLLMSKYPHILMEEISRSKEDDENTPYFLKKNIENDMEKHETRRAKTTAVYETSTVRENSFSNIDEISNALALPKYKLTLRILPKNTTTIHTGFKEVHTSINKSISKNGMIFSSMINVSELSRIENMNNTYDKIKQERPKDLSTPLPPLVKHIKDQQDKMKSLLKQHRMKIDEQLDNLKKERQNIENIISGNKEKRVSSITGDLVDVQFPLISPQMTRLNKDETNQLITPVIMKQGDGLHINIPTNGTTISLTTTSATTLHMTTTVAPTTTTVTPSTVAPTTTTKTDLERYKMLRTMQHNEKLAGAILSKIDKNTEILQIFLQKLSENIVNRSFRKNSKQSNVKQELHEKLQEKSYERQQEGHKIPIDFIYPKEWTNPYKHEPFLQLPLLEASKNETHVSIPFVYAYQQPYTMSNDNKPDIPMASVVYQGHIHTNALNKHPVPIQTQNYKERAMQNYKNPSLQHYKEPAIQNHNEPAMQHYRKPAMHNYKSPAIQNYEDPVMQNYKQPIIQNYKEPSMQNNNYKEPLDELKPKVAINALNIGNELKNDIQIMNQTKFFIDDLDSDFKVSDINIKKMNKEILH